MMKVCGIGVITALGCILWPSAKAVAATTTVAVPEAVVRSAPFEVAPEVARVHAGHVLTSDEQIQSGWRRLVVDAAVGTEVDLLPNLFLTVDLGFSPGFSRRPTEISVPATCTSAPV
jgi:hypothetical protein